jgi:magnesium-transporting ATPase (P-type)
VSALALVPEGLTDNVAELAPFAAWALTGGKLPLAIGVLQVVALDIGTDMLPALALGAEPPNLRVMSGRVHQRSLIDRRLLLRALLVLGVTEAVCALATFIAVLSSRDWAWGATPAVSTLAIASGSAFAAVALGQMATLSPVAARPSRCGNRDWVPTDFSLGRSEAEPR